MTAKIFVFLGCLLVLVALSSAATCAQKSYAASCQKCSFDSSGKMNQQCYEDYQGKGVACLFAAYPFESIQYKMGACKGIDTCVDRVETCKAIYSSGSDEMDCGTGDIMNCFVQGDICIAAATKDCSQPPPEQPAFDAPPVGWCDSLFFMILLFAGLFYCRKE